MTSRQGPPQTLCVEYVGITAFDGASPSLPFERPLVSPNDEGIVGLDQEGPLGLLDPDGGEGGAQGDRFIQWLEVVLDAPADLTLNVVDGANPSLRLTNPLPLQPVSGLFFRGAQLRVPQGALLQVVTDPPVAGRLRYRPTIAPQCCGSTPSLVPLSSASSSLHGSIGFASDGDTQAGSAAGFVDIQGPGVLDPPVGFSSSSDNALTFEGLPASFFVEAQLNPNNGNAEEGNYQIRLTVNDVPVASSTVFLVIAEGNRVMACARAQIPLSTGDVVRCQISAAPGGVDTTLSYFRLQAHFVGPFVAPPPADTVAFAVPGSDIFPLDLFHLRRALVGGTLARAWVAWTEEGGGTRVVDFAHGGSSADPTAFVPALAAATRTTVDLGSVSRTPEEVAQFVVDALDADGVTATRDGATVTVAGTDLVIPPSVDLTDESLRGMWGGQRDNWGDGSEGQSLNQNGGTGGIGSVHLPPLGTSGRVLGVYLWTAQAAPMDVRLAFSSGPAYSVDPGLMVVQAQGQLTAQGFGAVSFPAVAVDAADELWAQYRGNDGGGPRFRGQGATPPGFGDLVMGEVLLWDTTTDPDAAVPFGGTYTPVVDATFAIYIMIGVVFEVPDGAGNYPADGAMTLRVGDHNDDPDHGTQFDADASLLGGENTHQRFQWINWTDVDIVSVSRTIVAIAADEDSRAAIYQWTDLDHPSTVPATLVADMGLMGLTPAGAGASHTLDLATPVPMGVGALGDDAIISLGFNYVTNDGSPLVGYVLPVFLEVLGDGAWLSAWHDDRATWHDNIPGASNRAYVSGVQEYRQTNVPGSPFESTAQTWPDPMITAPTDDSPPAIALDWITLRRAGIVAV